MKPGRRPFTETYTCGLGPTHPQPMHRSSWDRVHTRTLGAQGSLSGVLLQIVQQTEIERSVPHFCISSSGESISKQHRCSLYRQMVPSNIVPTPSDTIDMPLRRVFGRISQVLCSADCHPVPASLKQGVGDIASAVNVNYVSTDRL